MSDSDTELPTGHLYLGNPQASQTHHIQYSTGLSVVGITSDLVEHMVLGDTSSILQILYQVLLIFFFFSGRYLVFSPLCSSIHCVTLGFHVYGSRTLQ